MSRTIAFHEFAWPLLVSCTISLCNHKYTDRRQSYVTTGGQLVSLFQYQAPIWSTRPDFITVRQLRICWCGTQSLMRGWSVVHNCCWLSYSLWILAAILQVLLLLHVYSLPSNNSLVRSSKSMNTVPFLSKLFGHVTICFILYFSTCSWNHPQSNFYYMII
jgi:hypothetical protein